MQIRVIRWQGMSVAVLAFLAAAPGIGQAGVVHRYSFTNDASDSVGGHDGTLVGAASVSGGQVVLDGTAGTYVTLPIGDTLAQLTNATFETWVTLDHLAGQNWARIFDFGNDTMTNMFLTPENGSNHVPRFALTIAFAGAEQQIQAAAPFPEATETHIAVTIDADHQIASMYMNGQIAAVIYNYTNNPSLMGSTSNNYLGKSQYADPYFSGSINEFRIYDTALSAAQIAASFAAGPDAASP